MVENDNPLGITRRAVIASAALIPVAAIRSAAQENAAPPWTFSASERSILDAFADRLIPTDKLGPGAVEAGAVNYIEQVLAGPNAGERAGFLEGLAALDAYARSAQGAVFAELPGEKKDAVLKALASNAATGFANAAAFFNRVRRLTLEGMFSDPHYGGNKNFAGWDLIRYPGPRLAVAAADQGLSAPKPYRASVYGGQDGH